MSENSLYKFCLFKQRYQKSVGLSFNVFMEELYKLERYGRMVLYKYYIIYSIFSKVVVVDFSYLNKQNLYKVGKNG